MDKTTRALMAVLAVLLLAAAALPGGARANEDADGEASLEVWLARIAIHEADFGAPGDYAAIWSVLRWRAEGPLEEMCLGDIICALHAYSDGRFHEPEGRTLWVSELGATGQAPEHWPGNLPWGRYEPKVAEVLRYARLWLDGRLPARCRRQPHHWGARGGIDAHRADRALGRGAWRSADCWDPVRRAPTRNGFFSVRGVR